MVVVAPPLGFVDYWNGVIMGERVCVMMIFFSKKTHTQLGTDDASLITNGRLCPLRFKVKEEQT
jgi:ammonia channel protein AmtB